jgi:hypothetical protein
VLEFLVVNRDCQKVFKRNTDEIGRMEKILDEAMDGA